MKARGITLLLACISSLALAQNLSFQTQKLPPACAGGAPSLKVLPTGGVGSYAYQWSDGSTANALSILETGWHGVTVSDGLTQVADSFYLNAHAWVEWSQSYDAGQVNAFAYGMTALPDGGVVAVGMTQAVPVVNHRPMMVKINALGSKIWSWVQNSNPTQTAGELRDVALAPDGALFAVGYFLENPNQRDAYVVKINSSGQLIWEKNFGGTSLDGAAKLLLLPDGGLLVAGLSYSNDGDVPANQGDADCWVFRLDAAGSLVWSKTFGGSSSDVLTSLIAHPGGGFVVGGYVDSNDGDVVQNHGDHDGWLLWLDEDGNLLNAKTFGGSNYDRIYALSPLPDGFVAAGYSASHNGDFSVNAGLPDGFVAKFDFDGNLAWVNAIGGSDYDVFNDLAALPGGGFLASGFTRSADNGVPPRLSVLSPTSDAWLVKLDAQGNPVWQEKLGFPSYNELSTIEPAVGGGYFAGGFTITEATTANPTGEPDFWVFRFSEGYLPDVNLGDDRTICPGASTQLNAKDFSCEACTYLWNDGNGSFSRFVSPSQSTTYAVTVTDACGNSASDAILVNLAAPPQVEVSGDKNYVACPGEMVGLTAQSCPDCTFKWSNGETTPTVNVQAYFSKTWLVTVTDPLGCTAVGSFHLTVQAYDLTAFVSTKTTCGNGFASATVTPGGGSGQYFYLWSGGQTSSVVTGLGVGNYSVTVSDGVCSVVKTFVIQSITNSAPPVVDLGDDLSICQGEQFTLDATPLGGGQGGDCTGCNFKWNTGATTPTVTLPSTQIAPANAFSGGTYAVTVTAQNGCSAVDEVQVQAGFSVEIQIVPPASCLPTGSATAVPTGGGGSYQFTWSNGSTAASAVNLSEGNYAVTVGDGQCEVVKNVLISPFGSLEKDWSKVVGTSHGDQFQDLVATSDGGFFTGGWFHLQLPSGGVPNFQVTKFDADGSVAWQKILGDASVYGEAFSVGELPGGDLAAVGTTNSKGFRIVRFKPDGTLIFDKNHGGGGTDYARSLALTPSGNLLAVGTSHPNSGFFTGNHGYQDGALLAMNADGEVLWSKLYGGSFSDHFLKIIPVATPFQGVGGYLLAGYSDSDDGDLSGTSGTDGWLLRIDENGNILWSKTFGEASNDVLSDVVELPDGSFVATGYGILPQPFGQQVWALRVSAAGDLMWSKTFGGSLNDRGNKLIFNPSGNLLMAADGQPTPEFPGYSTYVSFDGWLLELNQNGELLTSKTLGGTGGDFFNGIALAADGGLVLAGYSNSADGDPGENNGSNDGWLLKFKGNQLPSANLGADRSICPGENVQFNAADLACDACAYLWNDGSTQPDRQFFPSQSTTYALTVTDAGGCSAADEVAIFVKNAPPAAIVVTGATGLPTGTTACPGDPATLDATPLGGSDCPGCGWLWNDGDTSLFRIVNPTESTVYVVTVTAPNGCSASAEAEILVANEDFQLRLTTMEICGEGNGEIIASASGGAGNYAYSWSNGATTPTVGGLPAGQYSVTVSDGQCQLTGEAALIFERQFRTVFEENYPSTDYDYPNDVQATADGGFLLISSQSSANTNARLLKTDANGSVEWSKTLAGSAYETMSKAVATQDGGWLLGGHSSSTDGDFSGSAGGYDAWFFKLNAAGEIEWKRRFGGSLNDWVYDLEALPGGGFLVAAYSQSADGDVPGNAGSWDVWVLRLAENGDLIWSKTYGGSLLDQPNDLVLTADGGFALAGYSTSADGELPGNQGGNDAWILKAAANGEVEWSKNYGGSNADYALGIVQLADGGYLAAGFSNSQNGDLPGNQGMEDAWLFRLDETGNLAWSKTLGGGNSDELLFLKNLPGGNLLAGGYVSSNPDNPNFPLNYSDGWLLAIEPETGNVLAEATFGETYFDHFRRAAILPDGGGVAIGSVYNAGTSDDLRLLRFSEPKLMNRLLGDDRTICVSAPYEIVVDTAACPGCTFTWENGSSDLPRTVEISERTTLTLIATDPGGCTSLDDLRLTPYNLAASVTTTPTPCVSEFGTAKLYATGGSGSYQAEWSNGAQGGLVENLPAGTYSVTVSDGVCEIEKQATIAWTAAPRLDWSQQFNQAEATSHALPTGDGYVVGGKKSGKWFVQQRNLQGEVVWETQNSPGLTFLKLKAATGGGWFVSGKNGSKTYLGKVNAGGGLAWSVQFSEDVTVVEPLPGGELLAAGSTGSTAGDFWLAKLQANGAMAWVWTAGGIYWDKIVAVLAMPDGGCLLACESNSPLLPVTIGQAQSWNQGDVWLARLDAGGNLAWAKRAGGSDLDFVNHLLAMPDGNFLFVGNTNSSDHDIQGSHGYRESWLMKLTPDGETLWSKVYGGSSGEGTGAKARLTADGGIVVATFSSSADGDVPPGNNSQSGNFWLYKTDAEGELIWSKVQDFGFGESTIFLEELPDGRLLLGERHGECFGSSPCVGHGSTLAMASSAGEPLWQIPFEAYGSMALENGGVSPDGGYWMAGTGTLYNYYNVQGYASHLQKFSLDYPFPTLNLGADTSICPGNPVQLDADNPGMSYAWSTGETTQTIVVTQPETYSATVTSPHGCSVSDEMEVKKRTDIPCFLVNLDGYEYTSDPGFNPPDMLILDGGLSVSDLKQAAEFPSAAAQSRVLGTSSETGWLSPNPSAGRLTLRIFSEEEIETTCRFFDARGRLAASFKLRLGRGWNETELDGTRLADGVYSVVMGGWSGRWVKMEGGKY